jgi:hypothetical protein
MDHYSSLLDNEASKVQSGYWILQCPAKFQTSIYKNGKELLPAGTEKKLMILVQLPGNLPAASDSSWRNCRQLQHLGSLFPGVQERKKQMLLL